MLNTNTPAVVPAMTVLSVMATEPTERFPSDPLRMPSQLPTGGRLVEQQCPIAPRPISEADDGPTGGDGGRTCEGVAESWYGQAAGRLPALPRFAVNRKMLPMLAVCPKSDVPTRRELPETARYWASRHGP